MLVDRYGRKIDYLRISVTDRCNLRCAYCMPEEEYKWLPRDEILHFEEIDRLVDVFISLGVVKVRLTGGEPLLRRDLPRLIRLLAAKPALRDLAITSNGVLLADQAQSLKDAGLHRVTVSLDTLRPDRFRQLTRRETHAEVLEGLAAVGRAGFTETKIDTVAMRGVNDDEIEKAAPDAIPHAVFRHARHARTMVDRQLAGGHAVAHHEDREKAMPSIERQHPVERRAAEHAQRAARVAEIHPQRRLARPAGDPR